MEKYQSSLFPFMGDSKAVGSVCSHQDLIKAKCGKFASFHFFCANRKQCLQKALEFYTVLFMQSKPVKDDGFDIFSDPT
jgi:hypothetical protein